MQNTPSRKSARTSGPSQDQEIVNPGATPHPRSRNDSCLVVGVGASAGGLEAFTQLLEHLPVDTGMGFVLVQHLDPVHESALTHLLAKTTPMPVLEVTNDLKVKPNHVYVIPPNTNLSIVQGVLKLAPRQTTAGAHHSIDFFFESLSQDQCERAIGVVLSGTATDGTLGLEAIKAEGGITFAQDASAKYDSMPRSASAAGCVDFELSPENIAKELARIAKHPSVAGQTSQPKAETDADQRGPESALVSDGSGIPRTGSAQARSEAKEPGKSEDNGFKEILLHLRNHCGVDFTLYKSTTIQRRVTRRMVLNHRNTLDSYAHFLRGNAKELDALYSDVLISVTSFFRNPEAFDALKRIVFPALTQKRREDPMRVWVLGCSTGQEAYSIAMSYMEFSETAAHAPKLQIFATDLNDALLDKARQGLYVKNLAQDISPERLRRFFIEEKDGYRVAKSLRDAVVFARQNLISDPPFSRMDLISCRNLMIYLEPGLQKKILSTFHYALKPEGFLLLGSSESIGSFTDLFEPADKKQKIFARKSAPTPAFPLPASRGFASGRKGVPPPRPSGGREGFHDELSAQREADRLTAHQYAPPGVLINADLQILQFRGPTSAYLEPPQGKASFNVLKMAREGLMLPLRTAINKAKKENQRVRREHVRVNGDARMINIEIIPLKNLKERCYLVLFEEAKRAAGKEERKVVHVTRHRAAADLKDFHRISELERELSETRDYLQSIQEQHEAADEELQASHEEVQSANEELQSINEELETSKEELESTNEELITVNEEMANRNTELSRVNSDLSNLQNSVHTAIVLLSRDLTIRRFTSQAEKMFNLLASDIGRSLSSIKVNFDFLELEKWTTEVIDTVKAREQEVQDKRGRWYSLRARPYMTLENRIDGAVLMFVDIDALKRAEQDIRVSERRYRQLFESAKDGILMLNPDTGKITEANPFIAELLDYKREDLVGKELWELGLWKDEEASKSAFRELQQKKFIRYEDLPLKTKGGRTIQVEFVSNLYHEDGHMVIQCNIRDITLRKKAEEAQAKLAAIVESSEDAIIGKDINGIITSWNKGAQRLFGYTAQEAIGRPVAILIPPDRLNEEVAILEHIRQKKSVEHYETIRRRKDGTLLDISLTASPLIDSQGQVVGASKIARDITERKRVQGALETSLREKEVLLKEIHHRVKNNLQIVSSLLNLQADLVKDSQVLEFFHQSQERIQSMALIHEKLYLSPDLASVDMAAYIQNLATHLLHAHTLADSTHLKLEAEQVMLGMETAMFCGLIVNELVSNACKHAFPKERKGEIVVALRREPTNQVTLQVKDDGVGLPEALNVLKAESLGLRLVQSLVDQLHGTMQVDRDGGTAFTVRFPLPASPSKIADS